MQFEMSEAQSASPLLSPVAGLGAGPGPGAGAGAGAGSAGPGAGPEL
jgi:hypothetical protein